jgi:hypothetical protein
VNIQVTVAGLTDAELIDAVQAFSANVWPVTVTGCDGSGRYRLVTHWSDDLAGIAQQLAQLAKYRSQAVTP